MKRLLALAALLVAASACTTNTTQNTNTGAGNTNASANANAAATATPAGVTQADIEAKERQSWEHLKAKNWDAFAATLADDFVFVGGPGVFGKTETVDTLKKMELLEYTLTDMRFLKVNPDLAVITYTATEKSTYEGKTTQGKPMRNSTAWINRGGKWLVAYHQESEVLETPAPSPTPAAAASPAASPSASASPAASPAALASATDAEKAIWEAIKAKNSDAFASFLLPEALEVEPEGVFDKAAPVRHDRDVRRVEVHAERLQGDQARRRRRARDLQGQRPRPRPDYRDVPLDDLDPPRRPVEGRLPPRHLHPERRPEVREEEEADCSS